MRTTDLFGRPIAVREAFRKPVGTGAGRTRLVSDIQTLIKEGECLDVLKRLAGEGVQYDACVTDPPYHLTMTDRFGARNAKSAQTAVHQRFAKGFMGQGWDGGDVTFRPETWSAVSAVLRPGAFLLVFGGTRTHHRVWCAIEDAGLVIQDTIMWLFGSGFPKRRDMLKPAYEPICLAYKPGGSRELQIDRCRIGTDGDTTRNHNRADYGASGWRSGHEAVELDGGRFPANVCHDGSDEVVALLPDSRSGPSADLSGFRSRQSGYALSGGTGGFGDDGSAARFFYCAKADADDRQGSAHPTVKPTALMRWLIRLVVPEGGTVLDPFAGTGSTGAAALMEGVDSVLIEREPAYLADMRRKIDYFRNTRSRTLY